MSLHGRLKRKKTYFKLINKIYVHRNSDASMHPWKFFHLLALKTNGRSMQHQTESIEWCWKRTIRWMRTLSPWLIGTNSRITFMTWTWNKRNFVNVFHDQKRFPFYSKLCNIFELFWCLSFRVQTLIDFCDVREKKIGEGLVARNDDIRFHDVVFSTANIDDHTASFLNNESSRRDVPGF